MINVNFFKQDEIDDNDLLFAVIVSRFQNKWILAKHKDRETWDISGGHREKGEKISITVSRELQEETGAKSLKLYLFVFILLQKKIVIILNTQYQPLEVYILQK